MPRDLKEIKAYIFTDLSKISTCTFFKFLLLELIVVILFYFCKTADTQQLSATIIVGKFLIAQLLSQPCAHHRILACTSLI